MLKKLIGGVVKKATTTPNSTITTTTTKKPFVPPTHLNPQRSSFLSISTFSLKPKQKETTAEESNQISNQQQLSAFFENQKQQNDVLKSRSTFFEFQTQNDNHQNNQQQINESSFLEESISNSNQASIQSLVRAFAKNGETDRAFLLFLQLQNQSIIPDVSTYTTLIHSFAKANDFSRVDALLSMMQTQSIQPNEFTLNSLVSTYAKLGMFEKINNLFIESKNWNLSQESMVSVFNTLVDNTLEYFGNLLTQNALIDVLSQFDSEFQFPQFTQEPLQLILFKAFQKIVLGPNQPSSSPTNAISYNILLKHCLKSNQIAAARLIFSEMIKEKTTVDNVSFDTFINGLRKLSPANSEQSLEEIERVFVQMRTQFGFTPNIASYSAFIDRLANAGRFEEALNLLKELKEKEKQATKTTTNTTTTTTANDQQIQVENNTIQQSHQQPAIDLQPIMNVIYNGLVKHKQFDWLSRLLTDESMSIDSISFATICPALLNAGFVREVETILERSAKMDAVLMDQETYKSLIIGYGNVKGMEPKTFQFFDEMKSLGFSIDATTYSSIISCFFRLKQFEKAEQILNEAIQNDGVNSRLFSKVLKLALEYEQFSLADRVFEKNVSLSTQFPNGPSRLNAITMTIYLECLMKANKQKEAEQLFNQMLPLNSFTTSIDEDLNSNVAKKESKQTTTTTTTQTTPESITSKQFSYPLPTIVTVNLMMSFYNLKNQHQQTIRFYEMTKQHLPHLQPDHFTIVYLSVALSNLSKFEDSLTLIESNSKLLKNAFPASLLVRLLMKKATIEPTHITQLYKRLTKFIAKNEFSPEDIHFKNFQHTLISFGQRLERFKQKTVRK